MGPNESTVASFSREQEIEIFHLIHTMKFTSTVLQ
jgi:hypothetical protein